VVRFLGIEFACCTEKSRPAEEHGAQRAKVFMRLGFGPTSWIAPCNQQAWSASWVDVDQLEQEK
jgi:hypothetical protein